MVAQTRRISPGSGLNVDTAMPCARSVRPAWSEPSPQAPQSTSNLSSDESDRLDLDERAGRQLRDFDSRPRRRGSADMFRVHLVHAREVVEVLQEDGRLHQLIERATRLLEDRAQVCEDLLRLRADLAARQLLL